MLRSKKFILLLCSIAALAPVAACSAPSAVTRTPLPRSPSGYVRGQQPYQIDGICYYPIPSARGYQEEGIASWYGKKFHGRPTSSGEPYDMYAMTAAHKTLPLGTHVKVTHQQNNRSLIVRINDRGPFVAGRIIDLTHRAAESLDMLQAGTAQVLVEAIQVASQQQRSGETIWAAEPIPDFRHGSFSIQAGAFQAYGNALRLKRILLQHAETVSIRKQKHHGDNYYRVYAGRYTDLIEAHLSASQLSDAGFPGAYVVAVEEEPAVKSGESPRTPHPQQPSHNSGTQ
ncbi:septal ring lytic transglycosylase RlpA family protein [Thermodesulfobacteriota bacterium]